VRLLACPDCSRPYDVENLEPGTRLRCVCGAKFSVRSGKGTAEGVACGHCGAPVGPDDAACTHCKAALRKLLCPHCFAHMPDGAKHCNACGSALKCQALRPVPGDKACPRCAGELGLRVLERGSLVECGNCQGLWVEPAAFEELCKGAARAATPTLTEDLGQVPPNPMKYIPCLRCDEMMVRRQFRWRDKSAGVVLDHCRDHGVWLDAAELERVLAFVRTRAASPHEATTPAKPVPKISFAPRQTRGNPFQSGRYSLVDGLLEVLGDLFS